MARSSNKINIYLEIGQKRVFAGALDWPGWCRSGRDEASALEALVHYAPRYAGVMRSARLGFKVPSDSSAFVVREQLEGNATTDFGAPGLAPSWDAKPVEPTELRRLQKVLRACWRAFENTIETAAGKPLRTGPRGGGRQVEDIVHHVLDANEGYLNQVGWKLKRDQADRLAKQLAQVEQATLEALGASARGEIPARGPRGGIRWSPRYFVRRAAWHMLDHVWEIEDRMHSE
jgi:hypothetical protein